MFFKDVLLLTKEVVLRDWIHKLAPASCGCRTRKNPVQLVLKIKYFVKEINTMRAKIHAFKYTQGLNF